MTPPTDAGQPNLSPNTFHPTQHEVLRFLLPGTANKAVLVQNQLRHTYYHYPACPQYVILREEYGNFDKHFLGYIFEARGPELTVLTCWERSASGLHHFAAGYPYLRLPESQGHVTQWEYQLSEEIKVYCRSSFSEMEARGREILQVERRMVYTDGKTQSVSFQREYYAAGSGILRIDSG